MKLFQILKDVFFYTLALVMVIKGIVTEDILCFIMAGLLILLSEVEGLRRKMDELKKQLEKGE